MEKEIFRGKPVLCAVDESDSFYADLFCMLSDSIGTNSIIEKDDICRHHFYSLVGRLCDVCYCHEPMDSISEVLILYLATKISSEGVNLDKQAFNAS